MTLGAGGSQALLYDQAGNVIFDNRTSGGYGYVYDAAGRMVSFSINGVLKAEYRYNHLGQQIVRKLYGPSPVTIHSVYGPDGNRIAEYDEATGALIREYVWLNGAPLAVREGGVNYFIRTDHIGRPVFATNASGAKVWTATYLPFGGIRITTGTPITARFPGQWFQSESGLYQNWMRDYDPATGRYLQTDPLGLVDGASVYGYVRGNPGRWVDPRGEDSDALTPGVVAMIGAMCAIDGPIPIGDVLALALTAYVLLSPACECNIVFATHEKGARPSTQEKHEKGDARRGTDRGGEKGDDNRGPPRKPPPGYKGPWPPKNPE